MSKKLREEIEEGFCANVKSISTEDLKEKVQDESWVIVDTRLNDAYNGWKLDGVKRGGHIRGAVDFSANWLYVDSDKKDKVLEQALKTKGIDLDKNIVLYDANGKDALLVATYLSKKGYKNLYKYDIKQWANNENLPMERYKNYQMIVPASIIKDILDGKIPETFEYSKNIKIIEASWGEEKESYAKGHIPTSVHINTDIIEPPPTWMLTNNDNLAKFALDYGFTKDDTVIVSSSASMASYRIAIILRYIGVRDVRVLNGGINSWLSEGYELELTSNPKSSCTTFGENIPANPQLIVSIPELKQKLRDKNKFTLVDNRSWDEHIGKISGYSYYDKKGRIPGALYGHAGSDSVSLEEYRNIDNTMRNQYEILAMWDKENIDTNKQLAFMCGSGWRAAEVLTYANVMGFENTSLYSDGWMGWSLDDSNPIETGDSK
ncbi:thiosulfate sulfurtransferase [Clostridioides sp. ES-S-0005-03]|uniref:rhodanese-like domain-containing protein n=1 Tax=Clostridioides sp. ES-S-0005-03 TaxID=2770774 RepID=UPI001D0F9E1A|nr:thiosulfate sulfurtransferase [Clostridioides sp. ES-S-0005-03]UDN47707.1 thiosulfate sulfurtransferase [Clostridioides sp. ES-S-0173-01]